MEYRVLRNEARKSRIGEDERFVLVEITDDTGIYSRAEWLTSSDVALTLADPMAVDVVALAIAQRAVKDRPASLAREEHARAVQLELAKKGLTDPEPVDLIPPTT